MTVRTNIASISWGDHLTFGEGDGRLKTWEAFARRLDNWRDELGTGILHWRYLASRVPGTLHLARHLGRSRRTGGDPPPWDDLKRVPALAHAAGLKAFLYVTIFDEGRPLVGRAARERSHHNPFHGKDSCWESDFVRDHPEFLSLDRAGRRRHWGVPCLAYAEVRRHFRDLYAGLVRESDFDGLFVCLRSQSRPPDHADQFGYNEPVRRDFRDRYGIDITKEDFEKDAWRDLLGEYISKFLRELHSDLAASGSALALGIPRGDVLGPPLGNASLDWREWADEGFLDHLVIDQDSTRCPSMWIDLWPMHRGEGYVQDYRRGCGLPPLEAHVASQYGPAFRSSNTDLFVARQWRRREAKAESAILSLPGVRGLAFSTFRHDNPGALARNDWRA